MYILIVFTLNINCSDFLCFRLDTAWRRTSDFQIKSLLHYKIFFMTASCSSLMKFWFCLFVVFEIHILSSVSFNGSSYRVFYFHVFVQCYEVFIFLNTSKFFFIWLALIRLLLHCRSLIRLKCLRLGVKYVVVWRVKRIYRFLTAGLKPILK